MVLANSSIVKASKFSNVDLFWALKGGGSNFGIVTKFRFLPFPIHEVWGGDVVYPASSLDSAAQAFHDFLADPKYDDKAQIIMSFALIPDIGPTIVTNLFYAAPIDNPHAFTMFKSIKGQLSDDTSITSLEALANTTQARSPDGQQ